MEKLFATGALALTLGTTGCAQFNTRANSIDTLPSSQCETVQLENGRYLGVSELGNPVVYYINNEGMLDGKKVSDGRVCKATYMLTDTVMSFIDIGCDNIDGKLVINGEPSKPDDENNVYATISSNFLTYAQGFACGKYKFE